MVKYYGGCHCKAVTFEVEAPSDLIVFRCNCSLCHIKQNHHFIVPENCFTLLSGHDVLTEYRFNTRIAVHLFCKICGVQSFYRPRSNPNGYGVNVYSIDTTPAGTITYEDFDGQNWEIAKDSSDIEKYSKN
ncbi:hypothetical protein SteCoe_28276 [Stentor coeruleus]|uniref:CENP-V/GFA domain-containing protein n=1 Tax=Stentor coeruleus TaxID=5963 RepID=A0A1R2B8K1_9CILI|nr:hypothetical protein SteCoe_28276 [Stentor coeruleus]